MDAAAERAAAVQLARADFYFFSRWMFLQRKGFKWMRGPHHAEVCKALTRVFTGECKRLIINVPPRYSKTELAVINWMAWCLGRVPDAEFIHTSYAATLANNNSWQTRELVLHPAYREIFPHTNLRADSAAKHEWRTTAGGIVYAAGAQGTITGYGAGKHRPGFGGAIVIDDPHKADEATSDVIRQGVIDWFQNTLESRKNDPENTPIILIMQRLHEKDLAGWLLGGGNGEKWEHVCIPARNADGTAMWPEKHSAERLAQMEAANKYVFAGQYMQRPTVLGGGIIKSVWFGRYSVLPVIKHRFIYADTAQKTKEHNDYSVFQCWGLGEDGRIYLIDQIRGKWEAPDLERKAVDFWNKHKPTTLFRVGPLRAMKIEDKSSGTGLIQSIKQKGSIPVTPIERHRDKLTRVLDVVSYIDAGLVVIPEQAEWVSDFCGECDAFTPTDAHEHDDQIDPMCDAISDMLGKSRSIYDSL
jgi:predicted phage terminase large subunit-like protein